MDVLENQLLNIAESIKNENPQKAEEIKRILLEKKPQPKQATFSEDPVVWEQILEKKGNAFLIEEFIDEHWKLIGKNKKRKQLAGILSKVLGISSLHSEILIRTTTGQSVKNITKDLGGEPRSISKIRKDLYERGLLEGNRANYKINVNFLRQLMKTFNAQKMIHELQKHHDKEKREFEKIPKQDDELHNGITGHGLKTWAEEKLSRVKNEDNGREKFYSGLPVDSVWKKAKNWLRKSETSFAEKPQEEIEIIKDEVVKIKEPKAPEIHDEEQASQPIPSAIVVLLSLRKKEWCLLLVKRALGCEYAGQWVCPGGKVKEKEKPINAAIRELREETGIIISERDIFHQLNTIHSADNKYAIYPFLAIVQGQAKLSLDKKEVSEYKWVSLHESDSILKNTIFIGRKEKMSYSTRNALEEFWDIISGRKTIKQTNVRLESLIGIIKKTGRYRELIVPLTESPIENCNKEELGVLKSIFENEMLYEVRINALKTIGHMNATGSVEVLIKALGDDDRRIQAEALVMLGIKGKAALEPLILSLENKDKNIRKYCAEMLNNFCITGHYEKIKYRVKKAADENRINIDSILRNIDSGYRHIKNIFLEVKGEIAEQKTRSRRNGQAQEAMRHVPGTEPRKEFDIDKKSNYFLVESFGPGNKAECLDISKELQKRGQDTVADLLDGLKNENTRICAYSAYTLLKICENANDEDEKNRIALKIKNILEMRIKQLQNDIDNPLKKKYKNRNIKYIKAFRKLQSKCEGFLPEKEEKFRNISKEFFYEKAKMFEENHNDLNFVWVKTSLDEHFSKHQFPNISNSKEYLKSAIEEIKNAFEKGRGIYWNSDKEAYAIFNENKNSTTGFGIYSNNVNNKYKCEIKTYFKGNVDERKHFLLFKDGQMNPALEEKDKLKTEITNAMDEIKYTIKELSEALREANIDNIDNSRL